jgi:DNA-binding transcriptional LysR family regulator
VDATTKVVDLTRSPADVAVRMGRGGWPDVHAEKLAPHDVFPVCAPAFRDRLRRPADLARVPVIHDEGTIFPWADWFRSAGIARVPRLAGPTFSDPVLALEAALAGQGVVLAWEMIVADAIADGRLIRPFPTISKTPVSYWLLATPAKLRLRTVRAFRSWLVEEVDRTLRPRT